MKYQIGDTVLILHSNEEGKIVEFINKKMARVDVNGVEFPVYLDQIDFPYYNRFTQKNTEKAPPPRKYIDNLKKDKAPKKELPVTAGMWVSFLPVTQNDEFGDEVVNSLRVSLINATDTAFKFVYKLNYFGEAEFTLENLIPPQQDFYLHDVDFSEMNDNPTFDFEFRLAQPDKKKATHYETAMKYRAKQWFAKIEEMRKANHALFSHLLFEQYPDRPLEEKKEEDPWSMDKLVKKGFKVYNAKDARKHMEMARSVVDLHIEKITNDWQGLGNYEILSLQLKAFEKFYELAVDNFLPSIVFIHGVGKGKLRDEIHELLKYRKEVKTFVNQYDARYGYGATEIFFQY